MSKQTILVGAAPNDDTGDPHRTAFTKSRDNFNELYAFLGGDTLTLASGASLWGNGAGAVQADAGFTRTGAAGRYLFGATDNGLDKVQIGGVDNARLLGLPQAHIRDNSSPGFPGTILRGNDAPTATSWGGGLSIVAGNGGSTSGDGGGMTLQAGNAITQGIGGGFALAGGDGAGTGNGGDNHIRMGIATGTGAPGLLRITNNLFAYGIASGTGTVTIGNVGPGTTNLTLTAWIPVWLDNTLTGYVPYFT